MIQKLNEVLLYILAKIELGDRPYYLFKWFSLFFVVVAQTQEEGTEIDAFDFEAQCLCEFEIFEEPLAMIAFEQNLLDV